MANWEVDKFGGASVKDAKRLMNVAFLMEKFPSAQRMVVVSAMGKTTNALEDVLKTFLDGDDHYLELFEQIRQYHLMVAEQLFQKNDTVFHKIHALFDQTMSFMQHVPVNHHDYIYDQVVVLGELVSSRILSDFLNARGVHNQWLDARRIITTNNDYRSAKVDLRLSKENLQKALEKYSYSCFVTQGFIGASEEGISTTLGREGSDYSAALFANMLDANKLTFWKDVDGIWSKDPNIFKDAVQLSEVSFREAVEFTYYGAKILHSKTIQPLANLDIELHVRSFLAPEKTGSKIVHKKENAEEATINVMEAQTDGIVATQLETKDYSYISLGSLIEVLEQFDKLGINILQVSRSATTLTIVHQNIKGLSKQHWMGNILEGHNLYQSELGHLASQINTQNISGKLLPFANFDVQYAGGSIKFQQEVKF
ncbi:MAG: aspartate kinase [Saprospirales bacterium]|nr:aspartate kinase [Saprospirales bacterium]|tara:strand:+ start:4097 stop:5374 length:1278 start_codon:yes stop_codon:yes gene_type:complete